MNLRLPKARNISNPAFDPHKGPPTQTSDSVCGGERRSSGTRELLPQAEARDVELANAAGHAENEFNNRCDELAVAESQKYK